MALPDPNRRPSRPLLVLLLLASFALVTLDVRGGADSPLEPVRSAVGEVFGPAESAAAAVVRPFRAVPEIVRTTGSLRRDVARLEARNAALRARLATTELDRRRADELDGLLGTSRRTGYALVPTRVIAMGPAQSFSRTVTIDAGTSSGVGPDMTVINDDGLVGRVLRAGEGTATVLLVVDADSVVGGRLGTSMEVGFLRGRGVAGDRGRLDLDLVDNSVSPTRDDVVVTWGSKGNAPYVPGIPIGRVRSVFSSPRQLSEQAVIDPLVDFTALDLVAVVVERGTQGDRSAITAAGAARPPGSR